jgi:hypothetical protein
MQFFVRGTCTMIDAAVQRDVDGIPKGSHYARVPPTGIQKSPWRKRGHDLRERRFGIIVMVRQK